MQSNKFASFNFQVSCPPHSPMLQQKTYKTDLGHSRMETTSVSIYISWKPSQRQRLARCAHLEGPKAMQQAAPAPLQNLDWIRELLQHSWTLILDGTNFGPNYLRSNKGILQELTHQIKKVVSKRQKHLVFCSPSKLSLALDLTSGSL